MLSKSPFNSNIMDPIKFSTLALVLHNTEIYKINESYTKYIKTAQFI